MTQTVLKIVDPRAAPPFELSDAERHEIEHEIEPLPRRARRQHRGAESGAETPRLGSGRRHRADRGVLGISAADLEGVATFYSLIFRHPVGRHVIKVCDSIACHLTGFDELRDAIIGRDQTSASAKRRATAASRCCRSAVSAPAIAGRV